MVGHERLKWRSFAERDRALGISFERRDELVGGQEFYVRRADRTGHYDFVNGRGPMLRRLIPGESEEWIPNILPAPLRAMSGVEGKGYSYSYDDYGGQEESQGEGELGGQLQPRTGRATRARTNSMVGHEINYFSDTTEAEGAREAHATTDREDHEARATVDNGDYEGETHPENGYSIHRHYQGHPTLFSSSQGNQFVPRSRFRSRSELFAPQTLNTAEDDMAGRGRGRGGGGGMLKGATWEYDPSIKLESKPTDLFPSHPNIKRPSPITAKERRVINNYKTLQDQIHRGSLYTQPTKRDPNAPAKTFGEEQFNKQYGTNHKAGMDPFNGVETYSMRYAPKARDLPKLSDHSFNKELFPQELWATLEGTSGQEVRNSINRAIQKKAAMIPSSGNGTNGDDSLSRKTKLVMEKINDVAGDDDNEEVDEEIDAEAADDAYDDDDLGDDYNAEGYFDDGENDMEDDGDGGDQDY